MLLHDIALQHRMENLAKVSADFIVEALWESDQEDGTQALENEVEPQGTCVAKLCGSELASLQKEHLAIVASFAAGRLLGRATQQDTERPSLPNIESICKNGTGLGFQIHYEHILRLVFVCLYSFALRKTQRKSL